MELSFIFDKSIKTFIYTKMEDLQIPTMEECEADGISGDGKISFD